MTRMPDISPDIPFESAWVSWDLGEFRPCDGATYCEYPAETLPPLPVPDPSFDWLPPAQETGEQTEETKAYWADERRKLRELEREAATLGLVLPASFGCFMGSPELRHSFEPGCGSWFHLGDRLVPCPGFAGAYLIGFLRDQQDCVVWCLCLTPDRGQCVVWLWDSCIDALSERDGLALQGDSWILEEYGEEDDDRSEAEREEALAIAIGEIRVCAPSIEAFIQRYALECSLGAKLVGIDATPPTAEELRYLEHYSHQLHTEP